MEGTGLRTGCLDSLRGWYGLASGSVAIVPASESVFDETTLAASIVESS
jgi:hypothetical protein